MESKNFITKNQKLWDDCSHIKDEQKRRELVDILSTINRLNLVEWFKTYKPDKDKGFMFSSHKNLDKITGNLALIEGHSGASLAIAYRCAEAFFKNQ